MRYPIWKKDDFFYPQGLETGRIDMDAEAVTLPTERLPITWMFNLDRPKFYGHASDFKLEDHEITCEVEWITPEVDDNTMEILDVRLGGYYTEVERRANVVTSCVLKGVSVMMLLQTPGWPKDLSNYAKLDKELSPVEEHNMKNVGHRAGVSAQDVETSGIGSDSKVVSVNTSYYCLDCDWKGEDT